MKARLVASLGVSLAALFSSTTAEAQSPQASRAACRAAVWMRDTLLVRDLDVAMQRYRLANDHVVFVQDLRQELTNDLGFRGSSGLLAFEVFRSGLRASTGIILNLLSASPQGQAAARVSTLYQALQYVASVKELADNNWNYLPFLIEKRNPTFGGYFKSVWDVYNEVRGMTLLPAEQAAYRKTAKEQIDAMDRELVKAFGSVASAQQRLANINVLATDLAMFYRDRCQHPTG